jgi:hypothetical protein
MQEELMIGQASSFRAAAVGAAARGLTPALVAPLLYGLIACLPAQAGVPDGCAQKSDPPLVDPTQPPNLDFFKHQLLYYRCTRYDIDVAIVLDAAKRWVEQRAPALIQAGGKPAIVLDIDETSLSNWTRIYRDDFGFIPNGPCDPDKDGEACGELAWEQKAQAPAIAPTLDLYKFARCEPGAAPATCTKIDVFFVTGRKEIESERHEKASYWTIRNLEHAGYHDVNPGQLYMRDPHSSGSVSEHKIAARKAIEDRGYTIVANIGDQESDLVGRHAERTFKVPNPFYFIK